MTGQKAILIFALESNNLDLNNGLAQNAGHGN